jgi:negative regulator of flagellin synthesis FlgM
MQIYGTSQLHGAQPVSAPHIQRTADAQAAAPAATQTDSVDISPAADLASQLSDIPAIRQDRVAAIKLAIANGTYETADKLSGAVNGLLDEIG